MIVTRLKLANLRVIEAAKFHFQPGFNLIVGVNGVGKTTVLDALCVCLSEMVKVANKLRGRVKAFSVDDIRIGADTLEVDCCVRIGKQQYSFLLHKPREPSVPQAATVGMPREQVHDTPEKMEFFVRDMPSAVSGDKLGGRPLAVLFSTNRAVPSERAPGKRVAAGGVDAAFADAFANRELRLREFRWRCQSRYPKEQLNYRNLLAACRGGEGQPPNLQHCDTRKEDRDLEWNPADTAYHIETRVRYELDGSIRADDEDFDDQLNDVLNLNLPLLKNNRKSIYDAVLQWWESPEEAKLQPCAP